MRLPLSARTLLTSYTLLSSVALPALYSSKRLRQGFKQRFAPTGWASRVDIWLQAASGGEAYLAWEVLKQMQDSPPRRLLLTSCTKQGMEVLEQAVRWAQEHAPHLACQTNYFPFDAPWVMKQALRQASPMLIVLMETELWPGLMGEAAASDTPVLVANGRMTSKSLAGLSTLGSFWKTTGPARVLAMSERDGQRFASLFGPGTDVETIPNIKFDRVASTPPAPTTDAALHTIVDSSLPFVVLGSVREEEEDEVCTLLTTLYTERPKTVTGLFPRHMHRVEAWCAHLDTLGLDWVLRSTLTSPPAPGTIIVWDAFGELGEAYSLSRCAFVGGSLAPLGGQNFLEPLSQGIIPVVGPYLQNFDWIDTEIFTTKLARQVHTGEEAGQELVKLLKSRQDPARIFARFADFVQQRRGGTRLVCDAINDLISRAGA